MTQSGIRIDNITGDKSASRFLLGIRINRTLGISITILFGLAWSFIGAPMIMSVLSSILFDVMIIHAGQSAIALIVGISAIMANIMLGIFILAYPLCYVAESIVGTSGTIEIEETRSSTPEAIALSSMARTQRMQA